MSKKTLVLGASENPERYANKAAKKLIAAGHEVVLFGNRKGEIEGRPILTELPEDKDFDTITLYLGPKNQEAFYDYITSGKTKRVVFNPGTENPELEKKVKEAGIECEVACTLVLLATDAY